MPSIYENRSDPRRFSYGIRFAGSDGRFLQRRLTRRQAQEMVETNTYTPPLFTREARRQSGMGRTRRGTL